MRVKELIPTLSSSKLAHCITRVKELFPPLSTSSAGFLDIELPFTIKLPNATQVTYSGRMDDDRLGIYSVLVDTLSR